MWKEESAEQSFWFVVFSRLLLIREWVGVCTEDVKSTWSGDSMKISHHLKVSTMAAFQLFFPLLISCVAASAHPPRHLPPCQVVQMDVLCSDLSLRSAPGNLPHGVQMLDLSRNQSLTFGENTLQSLEELFLQGNDLTTLDHHIFQRLPSIKHLQLQQNNLKICTSDQNHRDPPDCVSFTSIPNLQFLNLSENNLWTLPANAFANSPLKLLDLSLNPGLDMDKHSLSGLEHSLVHLLLRENNISSLNTALSSLKSLKNIDLFTNRLNTLPMLNKESSIESLNLQNNNLVTLEYSTMLALEHSLKTLYMGSNPLSCCSNLDFLNMVQHSALVVPDIEIATCIHDEYSEPVNIEKDSYQSNQGLQAFIF
ncbi:Toll-like receptor 9 Precursor [Larimichthys crocea]|uniref:Toll-like receptor 9 n=1 Tax=Larimichthys crocea TaxID=215358 RepID=A0A6G0I8R1_LARCR|nr:Toll-like receptor 9 Precursor [Larimichthys crocea]